MSAKRIPSEVTDWYADLDANQVVGFRTPWGTTEGVERKVGYPQGSMSTAMRSKYPQDPLLRWIEEDGVAYQFGQRPDGVVDPKEGPPPAAPKGRAFSDDTRMWAPSWAGLAHNLQIVSFAAPRLGIGLKPAKIYARGNESAGAPPPGGLLVYSWEEGA